MSIRRDLGFLVGTVVLLTAPAFPAGAMGDAPGQPKTGAPGRYVSLHAARDLGVWARE